MKVWDILKNVGSAAIQTALPGVGTLIVQGVNTMLSDDDQLPVDATGDQIGDAINKLPPEQQSQVLMKSYDVKLEQIKQSHSSLQTMLKANVQSTHTTRPKIAYQSFQVIAYSNVVAISIWAWAVINSDTPLTSLNNSWPFLLTVTGSLTTLLLAYFGILRDEKKDDLNAAQGHKVDPIGGMIGKLFKR